MKNLNNFLKLNYQLFYSSGNTNDLKIDWTLEICLKTFSNNH